MPQNAFFLRTRDLLISLKTTQRHFLFTLHPLSPVIFATATVLAFVLLRNSNFNVHCYTHREATPTQKSARMCAATSRDFVSRKITKRIHSSKPASLNRPIGLHTPGIHINTKLICTGFKEKNKTKIVWTRMCKQSYRQTLTTTRRKEKRKRKQQKTAKQAQQQQ